MKVITLVCAALFLLMSISLSQAEEMSLKEAYSLFHSGEKERALEIMEDYAESTPDPELLYDIGYFYYDMKQFDRAREYFTKAFKQKDFFSPMAK